MEKWKQFYGFHKGFLSSHKFVWTCLKKWLQVSLLKALFQALGLQFQYTALHLSESYIQILDKNLDINELLHCQSWKREENLKSRLAPELRASSQTKTQTANGPLVSPVTNGCVSQHHCEKQQLLICFHALTESNWDFTDRMRWALWAQG